jgi:hypothetical protein
MMTPTVSSRPADFPASTIGGVPPALTKHVRHPCDHARAEQLRPLASIVPTGQCQPDEMRTGDWKSFEPQRPQGITPSGTGPFRVRCTRI